jgi:tripartite-type tricarboxylate transporter receptor subunit TctC
VISNRKAGPWLSALFAAAVICGGTLPSGDALAQAGEMKDGKLQPLADGFPNRPLTLVIADDPGTREGVYAVNIQAAMNEVSPVEVLVSNEPGPTFGTWFTIGDVATRDGGLEGYYLVGMTIPGMVADLPTEPITKETGLTIDDINPVIVTETIPYVGVQRKNAAWGKSFADMVKYAKENPGKITYISNQVGSGNDVAMEWVAQQLGIKFNKIPAESTEAQAAAMGAGEGDWALTQAPAALQLVQADKVDVTFVTGTTVPAMWKDNTNIVTGEQVGLPPAPFGIMQGFLVPKEVPDEHREWLFKLIKAAAETDTYKQREKTVPGLTVRIMDNAEANVAKKQILEYVDPVVRALGMHIDQQK